MYRYSCIYLNVVWVTVTSCFYHKQHLIDTRDTILGSSQSSLLILILYLLGDVIHDSIHIGSGICLTMICSDVCELQNKTDICPTTVSPSTTPGLECPEWDVGVRTAVHPISSTIYRFINIQGCSYTFVARFNAPYIYLRSFWTPPLSSFSVPAKRDICAVQLHNGQVHWGQHHWNNTLWMPPASRHHLCQWKETSTCIRWIWLLPTLHVPMWVELRAF